MGTCKKFSRISKYPRESYSGDSNKSCRKQFQERKQPWHPGQGHRKFDSTRSSRPPVTYGPDPPVTYGPGGPMINNPGVSSFREFVDGLFRPKTKATINWGVPIYTLEQAFPPPVFNSDNKPTSTQPNVRYMEFNRVDPPPRLSSDANQSSSSTSRAVPESGTSLISTRESWMNCENNCKVMPTARQQLRKRLMFQLGAEVMAVNQQKADNLTVEETVYILHRRGPRRGQK